MNGDQEERKTPADLRQRAEDVIQQSGASKVAEEWQLKRLVHELQVHQVQLVMQNEELHRSRLEIEQSHTEYANLYEFAPINYFTLDKYGLIVKLNLMGARLLGVERKFLLKKRWLSFVAPKHTGTFYDFFSQVQQTGVRQVCEIEILTHSGERKFVQLQGVASHKENPEYNECLLAVTDITALKKAEESKQYLHQFSQIVEGMPGLYLFLSPDLVVLEANKNYLQTLQLARTSVVGHKIFEIFAQNPPNSGLINSLRKSLQEVTATREQHLMDVQRYDIHLPGGHLEERYWRIIHSPILNPEGYINYIVHHVTDVTKEFAAQREIEKNRQRFEMLALASNDIVWEWDLNTGNWWWNRNLEIQFGYNRADLEPGMEVWANRLHPEDKDRIVSQLMQTILIRNKEWKNEYRFRRADGSYAFVLDRAYTLQDAKGNTLRVLGTIIDITEQKQTELALKKSNERFELLLETIPQMAWMSEPDGSTYFYNRKWTEYLGVDSNEIKGWGWQHYIHPEDVGHTATNWNAALQNGTALDMQNRWRRASDGQYRWHIGKILPVRNSQGNIIQWVGSLTDIHDQKLQEEALEKRVAERTEALQEANTQLKKEISWRIELEQTLRESQLLTKQIVDATPDIVHVYDVINQKTLYLNYAITHILGYTLEQIQRMGDQILLILIHPDDQERCKEGMSNLATSPNDEALEMEYRLKDTAGHWHWVWVRYAVFTRDTQGMPVEIIGIVHDITEKKKNEEVLKISQAKLKKLNEELEKRVNQRTRRLQETF